MHVDDIEENDGSFEVIPATNIVWSDKACFVIHGQVKVNFDAPARYFPGDKKRGKIGEIARNKKGPIVGPFTFSVKFHKVYLAQREGLTS